MLYKNTIPQIVLPDEHHMTQNICDVFLSQIIEILLMSEYKGLQYTEVDLSDTTPDSTEMDAEEFVQFLIDNSKYDEVTTIAIKRIATSVIEDFVGFVSESLNAIKSSKFPVGYALLRKPMMDELLMFEQILIDKKEFINRYYLQGDVALYDPSSRKLDNQKQSIISDAVAKLPLKGLFKEKDLYNIRYDGHVKYGLYMPMNQALHIITTHKGHRTPDRELNFVFANEADYELCWRHYYSLMPMLLMYSASVIDEIIFDLLPDLIHIKHMKTARRCLADMVLCGAFEGIWEGAAGFVNDLSVELEHACKSCGNSIKADLEDLHVFVYLNEIRCKKCEANQILDDDFVRKFKPMEM
jgi:hypothetical protein